jgi:hypothetical protein
MSPNDFYPVPSWRLLLLLGWFVLTGCKSADGPALSSVTGTVTLDGKPLAGAMVRFIPQGTTPGHGGAGTTDEAGKYEITAHRTNNRKGLLPGEYKVVLTRLLLPDGKPLPPDVPPINSGAHESIPEPYCKADRTPLTVTIGTEAKAFDCPIQSPH